MNHRRLVKLNQYMLMQNMYTNIKSIKSINVTKNTGSTDTKVNIVEYEDTVTQEYTGMIQI